MDEMKTYHIMPVNYTINEAMVLLEKADFRIIGKLAASYIKEEGYLGEMLIAEGDCDPIMIFDDMLVSYHRRIGNYYVL